MLCISPLSIPHPHGTNKKYRLTVPCGKCVACLTNRRNDWTIRLKEEAKQHIRCSFVTFTLDDNKIEYVPNKIPLQGTLNKRDIQLYLKKLRHDVPKFKYYFVGEYGTNTNRPHYHALFFGLDKSNESQIIDNWNRGLVQILDINSQLISYICKYHVNKTQYPSDCEPPFLLMSKGLGAKYAQITNDFHSGILDHCYYRDNGFKRRLPRYYKDKFYTTMDKDKIAKSNNEKINKQNERIQNAFENLHPNTNFYEHEHHKTLNTIDLYKEKFKNKKI